MINERLNELCVVPTTRGARRPWSFVTAVGELCVKRPTRVHSVYLDVLLSLIKRTQWKATVKNKTEGQDKYRWTEMTE